MKLDELKSKKVLILGFGREGQDTFRFLRRIFPKKVLGVADKLKFEQLQKGTQKFIRAEKCSRHIRTYLGKNYLKMLKSYDIIIKSPGIPFKKLSRSDLDKITSQTEIFFENCLGKIVGVTGTKGKSTTASLIYQILKADGIKAHLVGNIGKPVLSLLFKAKLDDVYICELSSHQLYNLKKSPHIAVLLNIYPEHLDYYRNFKEYVNAKANISRYQTKNDYLVYNSGDKIVREIAKKSKARKIPIPTNYESITNIRIPLRGRYNLQNIMAAVAVGKIFGVSNEDIRKAIKSFKPLPHRLELVGTFKGITFYNDALATIPEATIGALDTLGNRVETIMLGGYERNIDFKNLAKKILKSKIKNVILFPTTGERIWRTIKKFAWALSHCRSPNEVRTKAGCSHAFFVNNMSDAVRLAYRHTKKGKICLLSTASPSFSIFKDYKEKGNLFKKFVKKYARP